LDHPEHVIRCSVEALEIRSAHGMTYFVQIVPLESHRM